MLERIREVRANESGFTLIELLIVVVILGVLAGVVVFGVQAFNGDGKAAACQADKKNVQIASEAYYAKTGGWASGIGDAGSTDATTLVGGGYLQGPPSTTNGYTITYTPATGAVTASGACS